ncbi:MAG: type II secretion system GspH family protein [Heliobacteriaceae bacterium]|jgi:prepilin-type N-terminal cleavage/methylation domain-containing protein|nr:type II secretion system GspH family protein [Heliobacteriaceae bacterium]
MKKKAFTLAEVLITLGIIGVVAALVMPGLIADYRNKETVVRLKKNYTVLNQLVARVYADYDDSFEGIDYNDAWMVSAAKQQEILGKYFAPYLSPVKVCYKDPEACRMPNRVDVWQDFNGTKAVAGSSDTDSYATFVMPDGSTIYMSAPFVYGQDYEMLFMVDTNGPKAPNVLGFDVFRLNKKSGERMVKFECFSSCNGGHLDGATGQYIVDKHDWENDFRMGRGYGYKIQFDGWEKKKDGEIPYPGILMY